jgi:hypothetical protein
MNYILFSEMFTPKADALLSRDLTAELEKQQIRHSEYQALAAEQKLVQEYRVNYYRLKVDSLEIG